PRLDADHLLVLDEELDAALLSAEAAVGRHGAVGRAARGESPGRLEAQGRAVSVDQLLERGWKRRPGKQPRRATGRGGPPRERPGPGKARLEGGGDEGGLSGRDAPPTTTGAAVGVRAEPEAARREELRHGVVLAIRRELRTAARATRPRLVGRADGSRAELQG